MVHRTLVLAVVSTASLVLALLPLSCRSSTVTVELEPKDPRNPLVSVESTRLETSYSGPLHQFDAIQGIYGLSLKMEMESGQSQCFYYILTEGYQLTIFAASMSKDDEQFQMLLANSDKKFVKTFASVESVQYVHNVTEPDTYEVCLINSIGARQIMFSTAYYQPEKYTEELKLALAMSNLLANMTNVTESYIRNLETSINKALISIRYTPHLYRDYVATKASNLWVQRKSIAFIVLMLCSYGGTTLFIHYLFHVPGGKVVA